MKNFYSYRKQQFEGGTLLKAPGSQMLFRGGRFSAIALFCLALLHAANVQATSHLFPQTSFEIDGNTELKGGPSVTGPEEGDWINDLEAGADDPQPILPDGSGFYSIPGQTPLGYASTAIVDQSFQQDVGTIFATPCNGLDGTAFDNQTTSMHDDWIEVPSNVNTNDDICMYGAALEVVDVTDHPIPGDDQINYIYYGFLARKPNSTGDSSVYLNFEGPLSMATPGCNNHDIPDRYDDVLFQFDFASSGPSVSARKYIWGLLGGQKCGWIEDGEFVGGTSDVFDFATGKNNFIGPDNTPPNTSNGGEPSADVEEHTFYEFAINLTSAGIIPEDKCVNFTSAQLLTNAGNSLQSAPKDSVTLADPIEINNCGSLIINKNSATSSNFEFRYQIEQQDDEVVHGLDDGIPPGDPELEINGIPAALTYEPNADLTEIEENILIGDKHQWFQLIGEPDYTLFECGATPTPPFNIPKSPYAPGDTPDLFVAPCSGVDPLSNDDWALEKIECTYYDIFGGGDGTSTGDPALPGQKTVTLFDATLSTPYTGLNFDIPPTLPYPQGVTDPAVLVSNCTITNKFEGLDFGDAPVNYGTTSLANGARHTIAGPYLGVVPPDAEDDGIPAAIGDPAISDDTNQLTNDEDGVTFQSYGDGTSATFQIDAHVTGTNPADVPAMLCGYLDGAADGHVNSPNGSFGRNVIYTTVGMGTATAGAGNEEVCVQVAIKDGTGSSIDYPAVAGFNGASASCGDTAADGTFSCTLTFWPNFQVMTTTYARFRITTDPAFFSNSSPSPTGLADDGEVEDYRLLVEPTAVTIGDVELQAVSAADFIAGLGVGSEDTTALLTLLTAWDPEAAAELADAGAEEILAALRQYIDPDGDGKVAVLRWDTLEERGTIGFYVERQVGEGDWSRINGEMLPGLITAPMGAEYQLADPGARAGTVYNYRLIEQEARGNTRSYGPFTVEMQ